MMQNNNKYYGIVFLFSLLISFLYWFFTIYSYLSPNIKIATADKLVVEGWLHEDALKKVRREFLHNKYIKLISTGFPYSDGVPFSSFGKIVFDIDSSIYSNTPIQYSITLLARGTKAKDEYPHFRIFADTLILGESYSTRNKKSYNYITKLLLPPRSISVVYDNDAYTEWRDRNLYIYSVSVNSRVFQANSEYVAYYEGKNGAFYLHKRLSNSTATDAANHLINSGISDSLIIAVESNHKVKSKTYTTALDVRKWLTHNLPAEKYSLTIITQGTHARRSYISYKKAFGDKADIGVISLPDNEITRLNWWKTWKGWKKILYETIGVVYASIMI